jgi:hypothetical protein
VEVLEECERSVAGEEIHQVAGDGGHSVKDASAWGRSCRGGCSGRCLRSMSLWGGKSGGRRGGCSSIGSRHTSWQQEVTSKLSGQGTDNVMQNVRLHIEDIIRKAFERSG